MSKRAYFCPDKDPISHGKGRNFVRWRAKCHPKGRCIFVCEKTQFLSLERIILPPRQRNFTFERHNFVRGIAKITNHSSTKKKKRFLIKKNPDKSHPLGRLNFAPYGHNLAS